MLGQQLSTEGIRVGKLRDREIVERLADIVPVDTAIAEGVEIVGLDDDPLSPLQLREKHHVLVFIDAVR